MYCNDIAGQRFRVTESWARVENVARTGVGLVSCSQTGETAVGYTYVTSNIPIIRIPLILQARDLETLMFHRA